MNLYPFIKKTKVKKYILIIFKFYIQYKNIKLFYKFLVKMIL